MAYYIEILSNKEEYYSSIESGCRKLNKVQKEFIFEIPPARLKIEPYLFQKESYDSIEALGWLESYRLHAGGNRPYLILVVDGFLYSSKSGLGNLFGNANSENGVAVFTVYSHNQFVQDIVRFCTYYMVRYALSFFCPNLKNHDDSDTIDCFLDKKLFKPNIKISLNSGNLCASCSDKLRSCSKYNLEVKDSFEKLLKVVSNQHPFSLVMKGGGVKGLAFAGALLELERYFSFDSFVGASAGSIAAVLLGAGYKPKELLELLEKKDFNDFKDASYFACLINFILRRGLFTGNAIEEWINSLLKKKLVNIESQIRLCDLKHTVIYASRWSDGSLVFDSRGERKETHASFAARCSMSIPFYFAPKTVDGIKVYDGGLRNNFPLKSFMELYPQKPFVGLYLKSQTKKSGFVLLDLMNIAIDGEERSLVDNNRDKVVVIDTYPIQTKDFNLNLDKKSLLILSGRIAALEFIKSFYPDYEINDLELDEYKRNLETLRERIIKSKNLRSLLISHLRRF
jgi:predicted acylesterase/phospholipase RssA